jgi:hypothetical protein
MLTHRTRRERARLELLKKKQAEQTKVNKADDGPSSSVFGYIRRIGLPLVLISSLGAGSILAPYF